MSTVQKRRASRPRTPPRLLSVVRTARITPAMLRVTLTGEELAGFDPTGANVKLMIPRPGQNAPALPTAGPEGLVWPEGQERPASRTYTLRSFDPATLELDVDFVLHEHAGPATQWALQAAPGDLVGLGGPLGRHLPEEPADWYLLAGDETALPPIAVILEALPADARGHVFVEVAGPQEEQQLTRPTGIAITWLHRNGTPAGLDRQQLEAVQKLEWPAGKPFAWLAGEASTVVALRDWLRNERGLERTQVHAVPYWKSGMAEEAYHAERHRVMDE